MFERWHEFYLLLGTAAGALVGLLFVVASLAKNLDRNRAEWGADIYMTPIVFHFSVVLLVSALALVPDIPPRLFHAVALAAALVGVAWSVRVLLGVRKHAPHWSDKYFYAFAPAALYVGLGVDAVLSLIEGVPDPLWLAAVIVALMLLSIRNAWDLVTFLAQAVEPSEADDEP